jgi:hypothetical protein
MRPLESQALFVARFDLAVVDYIIICGTLRGENCQV